MALTTEQIDVLYMRNGLGKFHQPVDSLQCEYDHCIHDFARAIEAEVSKQDDALIQELVEALDDLTEAGEEAWSEERPCVRIGKKAITAGRSRLGEKT